MAIDTIPYEVYSKAALRVIDLLIERYDQLGMRASGNWADGLSFNLEGNILYITGFKYTEQLVYGRKPGKRPPMEPLKQWFQVKYGMSEQAAKGYAFGLQKKISEEGTSWFQKGGTNLLEVLVSQEAINVFYNDVGDYVREQATLEIRKSFNLLERN